MRKKIIVLLLVLSVILPMTALAADSTGVFDDASKQLETSGKLAYGEESSSDLPTLIGRIVRVILGILGVVLLIILVISGINYMTAGGNTDKVEKAKSRMINAVIGLVIVALAFAISDFVIKALSSALSGQEPEKETTMINYLINMV